MAYDEALADRVRAALGDRRDVVEKKMFGGLAFMVSGAMACGVLGEDLMARVGEVRLDRALARPHARVMDFTGRPSRNMVYVGPGGTKTVAAVKKWVDEAADFAETKAKAPGRPRKKRRRA